MGYRPNVIKTERSDGIILLNYDGDSDILVFLYNYKVIGQPLKINKDQAYFYLSAMIHIRMLLIIL